MRSESLSTHGRIRFAIRHNVADASDRLVYTLAGLMRATDPKYAELDPRAFGQLARKYLTVALEATED